MISIFLRFLKLSFRNPSRALLEEDNWSFAQNLFTALASSLVLFLSKNLVSAFGVISDFPISTFSASFITSGLLFVTLIGLSHALLKNRVTILVIECLVKVFVVVSFWTFLVSFTFCILKNLFQINLEIC